jgi:hypothetical protein
MTFLAVAVLALALAGGVFAIRTIARRRRTPVELRGDWWTAFEREFRAYAQQAARQDARRDRERRRHRGERA